MQNQPFQKALLYLLEKQGWGARSKIAKKIDKSHQMISAIASGKAEGTENTRRKIAVAFGHTYETFLELGKALIKAEESGGRDELFRRGLIYYLDMMMPHNKEKFYEKLPVDSSKFDSFLKGDYDLIADEREMVLRCFEKGAYENIMILGSKDHLVEMTAEREAIKKQWELQGRSLGLLPRPSLDPELLKKIIEEVENHLTKNNISLTPELKTRTIVLLYDYFSETGKDVEKKRINHYIKLLS